MKALTLNMTAQQITQTAIITFIGAMLIGMAANHPDAGYITKMLAALLKSFALYFAFLSVYLSYQSKKQK